MRDPAGRITFEGEWVFRRLHAPAQPDHFLHSALAATWVDRGDLVAYEWLDSRTLRSPKIPFVTFPTEWSAEQFHRAATLTLKLQSEATAAGWDLKDASAWNVVFDGLRPVFVDLLSVEPLQNKLWRAAGQFTRHFLLPLLMEKKHFLEPRQCMALWRDGMPPDVARRMLGASRFMSRYWPIMASGSLEQTTVILSQQAAMPLEKIQSFRNGLHGSLGWILSGLNPRRGRARATTWGNYEENRDHYLEEALAFKRTTISSWLSELRPSWVLDIGCNAGEFSEIAVASGARTICWDADSEAIATLCERHADDDSYHPILCPVDDISGGLGWMGMEFPGLATRLEKGVDAILMLAITHHLAIAGGVRLDDIFDFAAKITRKSIILELLSGDDTRVIQLCQQYNRSPCDFTIEKQYTAALSKGFVVNQTVRLSPSETREFAWLELRQ